MLFAGTWMDLEIITVSEISQKEKDKYHMISLIVKVTQSCLSLCDPRTIQSMELSRPGYWSG